MPSPFNRVALVQISANPAYVDETGVSYLHEPTFPSESHLGLHLVADIEEVKQFRTRVAAAYLANISAKIENVVALAMNYGVQLLVFPEYSIPPGALSMCKQLADAGEVVIVAGSHVVTNLSFAEDPTIGLSVGPASLGRAICPIFIPKQSPRHIEKLTRSKWESSLAPGQSSEPLLIKLGGTAVELHVSICLDAISEDVSQKRRPKKSAPVLHVIPSFSPSANLFYNKAQLLLASNACVLFANISEFGGSRAFGRMERANCWNADSDGTLPLPKSSEALVMLEADLGAQYEVRRSTEEHVPVRSCDVVPLLYTETSGTANEYSDLLDELETTSPTKIPEIEERVARFTLVDERVFPALLQDKIRRFLSTVVQQGVASDAAWRRWLRPVAIRSTTSTSALRWELCGEAVQLINELNMSPAHTDRTEQLTSLYQFLINKRKEIGKALPVSAGGKISPKIGKSEISQLGLASTGFEPPFYDREVPLDSVRRFVEASAKACLILAGIRGIGKSALAREVFKKVFPPTWKSMWITLTEGMSYQRLLLEVAFRCGLRLPFQLKESEASQMALEQDLALFFSQTARIALVIDDLQYVLDPGGDFSDSRVGSLLATIIKRCSTKKNKILFITTNLPRYNSELRDLTESFHVQGLDRKNAETLLSFWFHFEREDLRGQPVSFPERFFQVLDGHPLGLRIAAKMWAENPLDEKELSVFKKLRETIVAYVLDRVSLNAREEEFIRFASVFRLPVLRDAFVKWKGDEAIFLMDSFVGRSFLETDGEKYHLHPMIRDHFYNSASSAALQPHHRLAGAYYLEKYTKSKSSGTDPDPEMLAEAIYHYLAAGERDKVKSFALYKYELKPVALAHYRKAEYEQALKEYLVLVTLDSQDPDTHLHLCLIYARKNRWDDAEEHFGKAISLKPNGYWIYQGFAHAKMAAHRLPEAEHLLQQALNIKQNHSPTLIDLGRLREREGRYGDAEAFYADALEADPNNAFGYHAYAKFLLKDHRYQEGLDMAIAGMQINPRDQRNRELVKELQHRLQAATGSIKDNQQDKSKSQKA